MVAVSEDDRFDGPDEGGRFGHWPLGAPFFAVLLLLTAVILFLSVAGYAYERVGLSVGWFYGILIGSLVGSRANIPLWRFHADASIESVDVVVFGVRYRVPTVRQAGTCVLAVNVGGALIPAAVSVYLIVHDHIWRHSLIAVAGVAVAVWLVARPVKGVGVVAPSLLPPVFAAMSAILIGGRAEAALAYVGGTLGTLVGADLMNLPRIRALAAPEASIGGAGTFDGVFLSGLLAVVIATL
jgi:uncharacterized membrane protein